MNLAESLSLLVAATLLSAAPRPQAIVTAPEIFLAELRADPARPELGVPFELHLVLRLPANMDPTPADTLYAAEGAEGFGVGHWEVRSLPGDSVEIRAVYPVIAFREGTVVLPSLPLEVSVPGGGGARETRVLRVGAVTIDPLLPREGEGTFQPRAPAGVLGGGWSLWRVLTWLTGGVAATLAFGGGVVWWRGRRESEGAPPRAVSPREEAILALEALRSSGAHRDGRLIDFYAGTTGAVRRYASRVDRAMGVELTTGELMGRLEAGWGEGSAARIEPVAEVAEQVKFGRLRPEPESAERDWDEVREWIRRTPEAP